ncbi:putative RNA methyltransferase [Piscicoccus intestinalis]|uniref:putative RNA methyltransferase n=1 Tax=Piscicoccus intestinalis TaxID=746033 RepID=UPI000837EB5E|nr:methyltransferase domain-containing protein [Piscicoccus intestinalis]
MPPTRGPAGPATALDAALPLLACPQCTAPLRREPEAPVRCERGHSFDVARQGYLSLLTGKGTKGLHADDADMVASRERVQSAGLFDPVTEALTRELARALPGAARTLVDLGGGTGHYAAACLQAPDLALDVAVSLDLSRYAARRAARAHPRLASVVADAWARLPLGDGVAGAALCVFAPRNPAELARVLAPGGVLAIVTPRPGHLAGLGADDPSVRIDPDKESRLAAQLTGWRTLSRLPVEAPLDVDGALAADLLLMGPAAWHVDRASERERLGARPRVRTTLVVDLTLVTPAVGAGSATDARAPDPGAATGHEIRAGAATAPNTGSRAATTPQGPGTAPSTDSNRRG